MNSLLVEHVISAEEGLQLIQEKRFDCCIFDVMLPWIDWFELIKRTRKITNAPIIMTTAKGQLEDKQEWFEQWADDYLVKPYELKELLMRVQALIKRTQISDIYTFQDIQINLEDNEIIKSWIRIDVTNKERILLSCLLHNEWHPVSRSDISEAVWWDDSVWEKTDGKLDVYISNIRKKLDKELIETVKWYGYKIPRR